MKCYLFSCPRCAFTARVAGGGDHGAHCFIQTFECAGCRVLFDAATHVRLPATLSLKARAALAAGHTRVPHSLNRGDFGMGIPEHVFIPPAIVDSQPSLPEGFLLISSGLHWVAVAAQCPAADGHRLKPWKHPGRCPRCRTFLDRSALPFRNLD